MTVDINGNKTVGAISFTTGAAYTISASSGTLALDNAASNSAINVSGANGSPTVQTISAPISLAGTSSPVLDAVVTTATSNDLLSLSGQISGNGGIFAAGSGTVALTGNNSYLGGTTINGGIVQINSATSLGAASGSVIINAGTLEVLNSITTSRSFQLGSATSTIQIDGDGTYEIDGNITDVSPTSLGTLNLTIPGGSGTLILTGTNSYSGGTNIPANAVLQLGNTAGTVGASMGAAGTLTNNGTINVGASMAQPLASSTTVSIATNLAGSGPLNQFGGTLVLAGSNANFSGPLTVTNGTLVLGSTSSTGTGLGNLAITNSEITETASGTIGNNSTSTTAATGISTLTLTGALTIDTGGANNMTIATQLFGAAGTTITRTAGTGTLSLGVAGNTNFSNGGTYLNAFAGIFTNNIGAVTLLSRGSGSNAAQFNFNAGSAYPVTIGGIGGSINFGSLSGNQPIANLNSTTAGRLVVGNLGTINTTYSGVIGSSNGAGSGGIGLLKVGSGSLTLTGQNMYAGQALTAVVGVPTVVQSGTLIASSNAAPDNTYGPLGPTTPTAAGTGPNYVLLGSNGTLSSATLLAAGVTVANPIVVSGGGNTGTTSAYTLTLGGNNTSGTSNFTGPVTLENNLTFSQSSGGTLDVTGGITGTDAFTGADSNGPIDHGEVNPSTGTAEANTGYQTITFAGPGNIVVNAATNSTNALGIYDSNDPNNQNNDGSGHYLGANGFVSVAVTGGTTTFAANNQYSGSTSVSAGTLILGNLPNSSTPTARAFSSLAVSGGEMQMAAGSASGGSSNGGRNVLVLTGVPVPNSNPSTPPAPVAPLSVSGTGLVDLTNNDMIVQNVGSSGLSQLTALINQGYNAGHWNGTAGITSSTAAGLANTALGVELNSTAGGAALLSTFDGVSVANTDVLVKYTYYGDANLDGVVNGSDYTLIDNGFNNSLTGWHNGDFNYDGIVNGDDYTLIDNAFNTQAGPLVIAGGGDSRGDDCRQYRANCRNLRFRRPRTSFTRRPRLRRKRPARAATTASWATANNLISSAGGDPLAHRRVAAFFGSSNMISFFRCMLAILHERRSRIVWLIDRLENRRLFSNPTLPTIPAGNFNITSYGASTSSSDNTTAIQSAINAANAAGGGTVEVPAGTFLSGPLTLASKINLQIDSGGELQMLPYGTYPFTGSGDNDTDGVYASFITCTSLTNVEVSGAGSIDGQGSPWWTAFDNNSSQTRPYGMINFSKCTDVAVIGVTLTNPPNTHIDFSSECSNVTINGITINTPVSPNTDGIDMSAENALIENSSIADGDDNIAIGGTAGQASSNVTITNDTFGIGHGLSIGSYTEAGISGLTVSNCTFNGTTAGIRLKSERGRGGLVENLIYTNITMTNVEYPININSYYNVGSVPSTPTDPAQAVTSTTPIWQNITISNLTSTTTSGESNYSGSYCGIIWGLPEQPVANVTLTNVQISAHYGMDLDHIRNVHFDAQTKMTPATGPAFMSTSAGAVPYDASYWTDQDINAPAVAGNAAFDLTSHNFTVSGAGTGIGVAATDQFNFNSTNLSGNGTVIAEINSQSSGNSAAEAGIMIRNSTATNAAFAAVELTPAGNVDFLWRTTGGTLGSAIVTGQTGPLWVKLVDAGNSFTAFYGFNGANWTQIGSAQSISMGSSILAGLAVSGGSSSAANTAVFSNVEVFSILTGAFALPTPVTTTNTLLSVFASDVFAETGLIYTWSLTSSPSGAAAPAFSANDSNAAAFSTVTFSRAGTYAFLVTIRTATGLVMTSSTSVTVDQTFTTVAVNPANVLMHESSTQPLAATALDQFGVAMSSQPAFTWTLVSGGVGGVSSSGTYSSPAAAGSATVDATSGSIVGVAAITVSATTGNLAPTVAVAAASSPGAVIGTTANLSVLGSDDGGESNLTYSWAPTTVPKNASTPTFSVNGTNAAKNTVVTVALSGAYTFTVTIKDSGGLTATSAVAVVADQTLTSITLSPTSSALHETGVQPFTAAGFDQFGKAMSPEPVFFWSLVSGIGSINAATGTYTAPVAAGSASVQALAYAVSSTPATVTITNAAPTVLTPAAATPSPVTGSTTSLSVLGADDGGESNLIYTWAATVMPSGASAPQFSINGANAAKNTVATFGDAGGYTFVVTIEDSGGLTTTSTVSATVDQTPTTITVSPNPSWVSAGGSTQFAATVFDQFGNTIASPTISWTTTGSGNSITSGGDLSAGAATGNFSVQAAVGSINGQAAVTIFPIVFSSSGAYSVALAADHITEEIWIGSDEIGSPAYAVPISAVPSLTFNGSSVDLYVDFTNGDAVPADGVTFAASGGSNSLEIIGSAGDDQINVGSTTVTFDADSPINFSNVQTITVNGGSGSDVFTQSAQPANAAALSFLCTSSDTLNIDAGTYAVAAPAAGSGIVRDELETLSIGSGVAVSLATAGSHSDRTVLELSNLSIAAGGTLDMGGNDLIVHGGDLAMLSSEIAAGLHGPELWTGNGITSSLAADSSNMALGIELNSNGGAALVSVFDGQSVTSTDVLVKYTYFGDANLDGVVDGSDYTLIDNGFNNDSKGWRNGDFNYDGQIDGDDYTLIDNAFNTQTTPLVMAVAQISEPAVSSLSTPSLAKMPAFAATVYFEQSSFPSLVIYDKDSGKSCYFDSLYFVS